MSDGGIVLRIWNNKSAVDWNIGNPEQVTFGEALDAIEQICKVVEIPAFDYDDEDGDKITVRSEEEMRMMLDEYEAMLSKNANYGPLQIYPRVGKSSGKRNIDGLKVQTKAESKVVPASVHPVDQSPMVQSPMVVEHASNDDDDMDSGSSRKTSGDIHKILECANIEESDLALRDVLGSGNCGTVYKAIHKPTCMTIAVKKIPVDCSVEAQKQIMAELEILHRCNFPAIISFYGAYFLDSRIAICTEFMDGGSLDKYGNIPEDILGRIAVSVVKGLQYLWSLKIMHRDVKPSNVLVNTKGQAKLCDFGVSVQLVVSIAKTFVGTNAYMAPEKICGQDYRIQSEVWSLGISLFEMAVGKFPYESANTPSSKPFDLINSIVEKDPPRLPRGVFSDEFVNFVAHCMQKTPSARPAPEALMKHPFIMKYNDDNIAYVASWVIYKLEEMHRKKQESNPACV